jgi:hypothetical protein
VTVIEIGTDGIEIETGIEIGIGVAGVDREAANVIEQGAENARKGGMNEYRRKTRKKCRKPSKFVIWVSHILNCLKIKQTIFKEHQRKNGNGGGGCMKGNSFLTGNQPMTLQLITMSCTKNDMKSNFWDVVRSPEWMSISRRNKNLNFIRNFWRNGEQTQKRNKNIKGWILSFFVNNFKFKTKTIAKEAEKRGLGQSALDKETAGGNERPGLANFPRGFQHHNQRRTSAPTNAELGRDESAKGGLRCDHGCWL